MPESQGTTKDGRVWIVEDDREVALALWRYLVSHISALDGFSPQIVNGVEYLSDRLESDAPPPRIILVGTEHAKQAAIDVVFTLENSLTDADPLVIGLGQPSASPPERVCWEMWPAEQEPSLADRVRGELFGGPTPQQARRGKY